MARTLSVLLFRLASEVFGILLREWSPFLWQIVEREDRRYRADGHTGTAIDALDRVDVQHLGIGKSAIIFLGVDAVYGASVNASRVFRSNAGFRNYVRHRLKVEPLGVPHFASQMPGPWAIGTRFRYC